MEEDIKILEEYIEWVKKEGIEVCGMEKELPALENLLTRYKQLEEENKELREDNYAYHQLLRMQDEREYRSKFLKDFQKEYGKNTMPDYDEIYERYDKQKNQLNNSIPKSKVKEKIEEIDQEKLNYSEDEWYLESEIKAYAQEKIKELLEEE